MKIRPAEFIALLIALGLIVGVVGWHYQFIRDRSGTWPVSGITLPWFDRARLARVKIRRLGLFNGSKYIEAFGERPRIYPGPGGIRRDAPLIVTEGEFDALLLGQELGELAAVVTLGSASARPEGDILGMMLPAPSWFIATDADDAGDRSAEGWPARARRVRPPASGKDWTEAAHVGIDLRRWWMEEVLPHRWTVRHRGTRRFPGTDDMREARGERASRLGVSRLLRIDPRGKDARISSDGYALLRRCLT
jgi:hypothetical protein